MQDQALEYTTGYTLRQGSILARADVLNSRWITYILDEGTNVPTANWLFSIRDNFKTGILATLILVLS